LTKDEAECQKIAQVTTDMRLQLELQVEKARDGFEHDVVIFYMKKIEIVDVI
jgi:hypothetical protein